MEQLRGDVLSPVALAQLHNRRASTFSLNSRQLLTHERNLWYGCGGHLWPLRADL